MKSLKSKIMSLDDFLYYIKDNNAYAKKNTLFSIVDRFSSCMTIVKLCEKLGISTSGYYNWTKRQNKPNPVMELIEKIKEIQVKNNFSLGYRRMKIELDNIKINISESKTYRIMKKYGLMSKANYTKKNIHINKAINSYKNQIKGDFNAFLPNIKWCIDITTIKTVEGKVYLCAIIDLHDRFLISYKIYNSLTYKLVKATIEEALINESIQNHIPVILHSDHGTQFTNNKYKQLAKNNNITPSMSRKGKPTDNAVIESFFATLKNECVNRYIFETKQEAIDEIQKFTDYYNYGRIQLKTKLTPNEIRQQAA